MLTCLSTVPLEVVSPIFSTSQNWEEYIDRFWASYGQVFRTPHYSSRCGSHVHVSPGPKKHFTLRQLKKIACGIVYYAEHIDSVLPYSRRDNPYCATNYPNFRSSFAFIQDKLEDIWKCADKQALIKEIQRDRRRVLWNFQNAGSGDRCTGTVEFRGGRGLMGPVRTKWWIAFVVSFIQLCISSKVRDMAPQRAQPCDHY